MEQGVAPDSVFDDLYQVDFDIDLPDWWPDRSQDYAICARIERAWLGFCIGDVVTDEPVGLDAWVTSNGQIEIHLITADAGPINSEALLARVEVSDIRTRTILVEFDETHRSAADLIRAADEGEAILGFSQLSTLVPDEPGLTPPAKLVESEPTG